MLKINPPSGLPDSLIVRELRKKSDALSVALSRKPDYLGWLKALRDRIAPASHI